MFVGSFGHSRCKGLLSCVVTWSLELCCDHLLMCSSRMKLMNNLFDGLAWNKVRVVLREGWCSAPAMGASCSVMVVLESRNPVVDLV